MTVKFSSSKVSRLIRMFLLGKTQVSISLKLKITQPAVSLYVQEFSMVVDENGLEVAAEEYGVMDIVKEMHSLGAELKNSGLTIEEAKKGIKASNAFEECGVSQEKYNTVVATCVKVQQDGFLQAAIKLHQLEKNTGLSSQQIVTQAEASHTQLVKEKEELFSTKAEISQAKLALSLVQQRIQKAGMDAKRLEKVEALAAALKDGGVTDKELDGYIQRQSLLNKSGVSINTFGQILDAAKVTIAADAGKGFLKKLTAYGGLNEAVIALKQEKQSLTIQVEDLGEKATLKGSLQAEIAHLQVQKKELDGAISKLLYIKQTTENSVQNLKNNQEVLLNNAAVLNQTISEEQLLIKNLDKDIKAKQENVADLTLLETKRTNVAAEYADLEAKAKTKKEHLMILEAFEGYMQSTDLDKQEKFVAVLPQVLEETKRQKSSPDFIRAYIFKTLTGGTLRVLRCSSCDTRFYTDKTAGISGYRCPACSTSYGIHEDKDEADILREILAYTEPKIINPVIKVGMIPSSKPAITSNAPDKSSGNVNNKG